MNLNIADKQNLSSMEELCKKMNIDYKFLKYVLFKKKNSYKTFLIPKKNGYREINVPCDELKNIQKNIKEYLEKEYLKKTSFPNCVKGFLKNESIVTNAMEHYRAKHILTIDLENFFPSIHFGRIRGLFLGKPFYFSNNVATLLAKIACKDGKLPQGSPLSPILSNFICYRLDYNLNNLAKKYNCKYTRYADDITISTTRLTMPIEIAYINEKQEIELNEKLEKIILDNSFYINKNKTKLRYLNYRQEVTGLVVNEKVNVPKIFIKKLRSESNYFKYEKYQEYGKKYLKLEKIDEDKIKEICRKHIIGKLNYLKMVRGKTDKVFLKYAKQFNEIFDVNQFDVSYLDKSEYVKERCYIIHDFEDSYNGTGFLTKEYGLITCTHNFLNQESVEGFYEKIKNEDLNTNLYEKYGLKFLCHRKNETQKQLLDLFITKSNYIKDVCNCKIDMRKKKFDKVRIDYEPQIGEEVLAFGFGNYFNENNNSFKMISYKIVSKDKNDLREYYALDRPVVHGMSGGPVLNQNMEVIGILAVGSAYSYEEFNSQIYNDGSNGFFALKDIKDLLKPIK